MLAVQRKSAFWALPLQRPNCRLDIVAKAAEKGLVGQIVFLKYRQDDCDTYAIGQINKVTLKNLFAEDQTMKSLTRQRGEVPSITESQDTHTAVMMISAVFREDAGNFAQGIFGTVPPTNTAIRIIDQGILNRLVERHASHIVRVGKVFGSDVLLPSWFRHFGSVDDGDLGTRCTLESLKNRFRQVGVGKDDHALVYEAQDNVPFGAGTRRGSSQRLTRAKSSALR